MRGDLLEPEAVTLRCRQRLANGIQGLVVATCCQMDLSACDLCVWDAVRMRLVRARRRFTEDAIHEALGFIRLSELEARERQPRGRAEHHRPLGDFPSKRE